MDAYPVAGVYHNIPFVVLSGLETASQDGLDPRPQPADHAITLQSELPDVQGNDVDTLRRYLLSVDASNAPWAGRDGQPYLYKIRAVGNVRPQRFTHDNRGS